MWIAQHITTSIARPPAEVVAFASDLARWAEGVSDDMTVTFAPGREFGILDHDVEVGGQTFHNPFRVLANDDGSEVVFTLYRRDGVTDDAHASDVAAITADLARLKGLLEK